MTETAEERLLRERQEYEDALQAYRTALGTAAQQLPIPYSLESNYSVEGQGYERAATDPWITERFPEVAQAARLVQAEEGDYLALDEPMASHAQGNCGIGTYTAQKVYEYYAALEMVFKLATDAEFREQTVSQLHQAFRQSAIMNQSAADLLRWQAGNMDDQIEEAERRESGERSVMDRVAGVFGYEDADDLSLAIMGYDSEEEFWAEQAERGIVRDERTAAELRAAQEEMRRQAQIYQETAIQQVLDFFRSMWEDIKRRYAECGLFYAVVTTGIDGVFLAGEVLAGMAVLRGLKFVRISLPGRRVRIDVTDVEGRRLNQATWDNDALEAKYGTPQENHVGGFEPDRNRDLPDTPAEDVPRRTDRDGDGDRPRDDDDPNAAPRRAPRRDIDCFDVPRGVDRAEFDRQLREQQDTINTMTADEMGYAHAVLDQAREVWRESGRSGSFTQLLRGSGGPQRAARAQYQADLEDLDLDDDEIARIMSGVAATHDLDIIAGGDPTQVGIGGRAENSRIGPAWTYRNTPSGVSRTDQIRGYADGLRTAGRSDDLLNVRLSSCD